MPLTIKLVCRTDASYAVIFGGTGGIDELIPKLVDIIEDDNDLEAEFEIEHQLAESAQELKELLLFFRVSLFPVSLFLERAIKYDNKICIRILLAKFLEFHNERVDIRLDICGGIKRVVDAM